MNWRSEYAKKKQTAEQALESVRSGMRVYIQPGCAEPETLVEALLKRGPFVRNVEVVHLLTLCNADYVKPEMEGHFRHNAIFIGVAKSKQVNDLDVPHKRAALQERFHQGFGLGTAWLNVNPHPGPDRFESLLRGLLLFCILASPVHTEPFSKRLTASVSWPRTAGGTRRIRDGRWPAPASLP